MFRKKKRDETLFEERYIPQYAFVIVWDMQYICNVCKGMI